MNNICKEYCEMISNNFKENVESIIIYGSNIYNASSSDLDVCIIVKENNDRLQQKVIKKTLQFHHKYNLKIDEEIPHTNKLIYSIAELDETIKNPPFYRNGKIEIPDIVKKEEFLSSKDMKQRLLLNILTTDHLTIGKSVSEYEKSAFKIMLNVIINYFNLSRNSVDEILECFYKNKFTGAEGEMYLGYKKNYQEKDKYLRRKIKEYLYD